MIRFWDLASLAKPLVTAPLALAFLDLDADRRWALGFHDRAGPLNVRQLLSHSAGLPPWLPYTGEPLAAQLRREFPEGAHPLLRRAQASYSDLGYRLLAELIEVQTGVDFTRLGAAASGLSPAPWNPAPVPQPPGPDAEAWRAYDAGLPFPKPAPDLPHDANARAGMKGHAGFGATAPQLEAALQRWVGAWPLRMAVETVTFPEGEVWGLGLQRARRGPDRFAERLAGVPDGIGGVHVVEGASLVASRPAPLSDAPWWFHLAYTGPALFFRPSDGCCIALLLDRRGEDGLLLDAETMRGRRWETLGALAAKLLG